MQTTDIAYYRARAAEEDGRADASAAGPVRDAHRALAGAYREHVGALEQGAVTQPPSATGQRIALEPSPGGSRRPAHLAVQIAVVKTRDPGEPVDRVDPQDAFGERHYALFAQPSQHAVDVYRSQPERIAQHDLG